MADELQPFDPNLRDAQGRKLGRIPLKFILPNLITVLAICAGLTGIRMAFEGRIGEAVWLVLLAAFLDGIDGRLARAMKAQSKFGAQMDSLADIINFGAAPALVLYAAMLDQTRQIGWIAALVYAIACGLRLARFNVMQEEAEKPAWMADYFVGVPAPFGAFLVMLPVYLNFMFVEISPAVAVAASFYTIFVALLMISQLPVFSGKSVTRIPGNLYVPVLMGTVVYVALLLTFTWETLSISAVAYLASLPMGYSSYLKRHGSMQAAEKQEKVAKAEKG